MAIPATGKQNIAQSTKEKAIKTSLAENAIIKDAPGMHHLIQDNQEGVDSAGSTEAHLNPKSARYVSIQRVVCGSQHSETKKNTFEDFAPGIVDQMIHT